MSFAKFMERFANNFTQLTANATHLYEVDVDKDTLWNLYLDSFPAGTNEIYRERREHDCSCCRHFIKSFGNVVVIEDNQVKTIWDFDTQSTTYQPVVDALSAFIKANPITDVYVSKFAKIGTKENFERMPDGKVQKWNHFYIELPSKFVDRSHKSIGEVKGEYRDTKNVFKRSLDEITVESLETVLELISQNSLYKGEEWLNTLKQFLEYKKEYDALETSEEVHNYAWSMSTKVGAVIGRIRNHSIGTLLVNLSEDMDLDLAVRKYEQIVAPSNYKRPKAIFTKKMLENAKKTIEELGYMDSLERRYATLDDISVNNILFSNKDSAKRISGASVFDDMAGDIAVNPKKFSRVEEVAAETFVKNILPTAREVEVLLENKHAASMVSLIAPKNPDAKTMFKWNNGFSWAYSGNMTDSSMKENVKAAGGNVDGVLRFSIQWNDGKVRNFCDYDAHCMEPGCRITTPRTARTPWDASKSNVNGHIFFVNKCRIHPSSGMLDVDIMNPSDSIPAVENIVWTDKSRMPKGTYRMYVHCYNARGGNNGFAAEIEFDGQIYTFECNKPIRDDEIIDVAEVTWDGVNFTIKEKLPSNVSSREVWGLKTNQFVPVSVVCYSPNYWDEQSGIGHKHYFFMLKDCVNPEQPNGFYNEFVKQELVQHKRVFEALGSKMAVAESADQLSGLGFSSTKRNELIVKVKGTTERVLKIKF